MKKLLVCFIALMLCLPLGAQAALSRILDDADLFTPDEEAVLQEMIADFQHETGMDFVLYTSDVYHEAGIQQDIADDLYDYGGYGLDDEYSGILYFIDMYERIPYLSTTGAMIDYMTDERIDAAHEASYNFLASGQYADAAAQMIYSVFGYWEKGIPEGQFRYDVITGQILTSRHKVLTKGEIVGCALIAAIVALVFVKLCKHDYTLKGSTYHYAFRENSRFTLTGSYDSFKTVRITNTPKSPPPSSSGSGRSYSGSSVHTSSSGRTHGGGAGRKF